MTKVVIQVNFSFNVITAFKGGIQVFVIGGIKYCTIVVIVVDVISYYGN